MPDGKGGYSGGIAFECSPHAINLKTGPRAYPITTTIQVPKGMEGPSKGMKRADGTAKDPDLEMRQRLIKVSWKITSTAQSNDCDIGGRNFRNSRAVRWATRIVGKCQYAS